jgi:hypothetical protein
LKPSFQQTVVIVRFRFAERTSGTSGQECPRSDFRASVKFIIRFCYTRIYRISFAKS